MGDTTPGGDLVALVSEGDHHPNGGVKSVKVRRILEERTVSLSCYACGVVLHSRTFFFICIHAHPWFELLRTNRLPPTIAIDLEYSLLSQLRIEIAARTVG